MERASNKHHDFQKGWSIQVVKFYVPDDGGNRHDLMDINIIYKIASMLIIKLNSNFSFLSFTCYT